LRLQTKFLKGSGEQRDIPLGNKAAKLEATALFIDMRQSSNIANAFRLQTAAKMVKGYFDGAIRIIGENGGQVRSFDGDGMLAIFVGDLRFYFSVGAAMQVEWFVSNILQPRLERYFENNRAAMGQSLGFEIGCGLDDSSIFAVRVGLRGKNDVAWVGKGTNTAAKLASKVSQPHSIGITREIYDRLDVSYKYDRDGTPMWSEENFEEIGSLTRAIRTTNYWSVIQ
jgi:adenylate cyclase